MLHNSGVYEWDLRIAVLQHTIKLCFGGEYSKNPLRFVDIQNTSCILRLAYATESKEN